MLFVYLWGAALILFLVVEAITAGLTSIWFAAGALVALIIALLHGSVLLQFAAFLIVTGLTVFGTRSMARKYVNSRTVATNADRLLGAEGLVLEPIDNVRARGTVKVDGKVWSARSGSGEAIPADTLVLVDSIDGVKLIVRPAAQAPAAESNS